MATIGMLAAILTTGCWLPQLLRSWRTRSVGDISWVYLLALGTGVFLWAAYGLATGDLPIVLANTVTGAALLALVAMKARFTPRETP